MISSLETIYADLKAHNCYNSVILDNYIKAHKYFTEHNKIFVSVSGGSDSDIMVDICKRLDPDNEKCDYVWFDTGLEYQATKNHITYLENRYNITIRRERAIKSIPTCCKEYGQPFLSKQVSKLMGRLQKVGFQWEDEPYEVLVERYPNSKDGLKWWCNKHMEAKKMGDDRSRFNIEFNKWLKEFIISNPPWFKISNKCCDFAKKKIAHKIYKEGGYDLSVIGVRKAEGGIRASVYKSCFNTNDDGTDSYRPLFWYLDKDKKEYEECFNIVHSECYTKYNFPRTGCTCCPYANKDLRFELEQTEKYEPKLYKAACNIFKDSYEYTKQWHEYKMKMKWHDKTGITRLF